ncbi:MAG: hypothetical protein K6E19_00715, partial [Lachnospiraceae bacterium]|nr:hypothetical protein [Lachnospiraceae bacterium]
MRKISKLMACVLAGAMTLSLAGCADATGNGGSSVEPAASTSTETSASASVSTSTSEEVQPAEVVKPDKIKVMWDGTIFKEGDNYAEDFYKALSDELGIEIEWVRPDHSSYAEQVGIAFNDRATLADVVILPANYYAAYASQGNLWNMTDAWLASDTANSGRLTSAAAKVIDGWYVTGPDGQKGISGY